MLSPAQLRGRAYLLAVIPSPSSAGGERAATVLRRVATAHERLLPELQKRFVSIVLLTDPTEGALQASRQILAHMARPSGPVYVVRDPHDAVLELAGRLGVAVWPDGDQHVAVEVMDRRGRRVDAMRGIEDWEEGDLLAAMAMAARR